MFRHRINIRYYLTLFWIHFSLNNKNNLGPAAIHKKDVFLYRDMARDGLVPGVDYIRSYEPCAFQKKNKCGFNNCQITFEVSCLRQPLTILSINSLFYERSL